MATLKKYLTLFFSLLSAPALAAAPNYAITLSSHSLTCSVPSIQPGPLANGLGFLWYNVGGLQYDFIGHNIGSYSVASPLPLADGNTTDFNTSGVSFPNFSGIKTSNGSGTGAATIFMLAAPATSGGGGNNYLLDFGSAGPTLIFMPNTDQNGLTATGQMALFVYDGVTTHYATTTTSVIDGGFHMWVGIVNGAESNWQIYVDGTSQPLAATSNGAYTSIHSPKAGMGGYWDGSTHAGGYGVFGGEYERALTPQEVVALSTGGLNAIFTCS